MPTRMDRENAAAETPAPGAARPRTAVFRADASPEIGSGHVMRCLALADHLARSDWRCIFAAGRDSTRAVPSLQQSTHALLPLNDDDISVAGALKGGNFGREAVLVVDSYRLGEEYESECRSWVSKVVVLDDVPDRRHDCDVLVDPAVGRSAGDYAKLVPKSCTTLAGPAYALLRPTFREARLSAARRQFDGSPIERILINFGSTDPANLTATALEGVKLSRLKAEIDVVLGPAAPHIPAVQATMDTLPNRATLHLGTNDMADLMSRADIGIGAAGTSALERCCVGLPSIVIVAADNQSFQARKLAELGIALALGAQANVGARDIADALLALAGDADLRGTMSQAGMNACDGLGAERVEAALAGICG